MSKDSKTVILNGSRVWFALICFVVIHGASGIWWASSINTRMAHVEKGQTELKQSFKEDVKEIKEIIRYEQTKKSSKVDS